MSINYIYSILKANNISPKTRVNGQTAYQFLEGAVLGALNCLHQQHPNKIRHNMYGEVLEGCRDARGKDQPWC